MIDPAVALASEKLQVFLKWRDSPSLSSIPDILEKRRGREFSIFFELEQDAKYADVAGWSLTRDAIVHYNAMAKTGKSKQQIDDQIQAWHAAHKNNLKHEGATGVFTQLWSELAQEAAYYKHRHEVVTLLCTAGYINEVCNIDGTLTEFWTREEVFVESMKQQLGAIQQANERIKAWIVPFTTTHRPNEVDQLQKHLADPQNQSLLLAMTYLRQCTPADYQKVALWEKNSPNNIKIALIDYLNHRMASDMALVEKYIAEVPDQQLLVREVLKKYETAQIVSWWETAIASGRNLFFPPWRNVDFPRDAVPQWEEPIGPASGMAVIPIPWEADLPTHPATNTPSAPQGQQQPQKTAPPPTTSDSTTNQQSKPKTHKELSSAIKSRWLTRRSIVEQGLSTKQVAPPAPPGDPKGVLKELWVQLIREHKDEGTRKLRQGIPLLVPNEWSFKAEDDVQYEANASMMTMPPQQGFCRQCTDLCTAALQEMERDTSVTSFPNLESKCGSVEMTKGSGTSKPFSGGWVSRYMKATTFGVHWYLSSQPQHIKFPIHSVPITPEILFIEKPDEAFPQATLNEAGWETFGIRTRKPDTFFWMRTREATWRQYFKQAFSIVAARSQQKSTQALSESWALWQHRIPKLLEVHNRKLSELQKHFEQAEEAQLNLCDISEKAKRQDTIKDWKIMQASAAECVVSDRIESLRKTERERDKLKAELALLKQQADQYRAQNASITSDSADSVLSLEQQQTRQQRQVDKILQKLHNVRKECADAKAETARIQVLINPPPKEAPAVPRLSIRSEIEVSPFSYGRKSEPRELVLL
eukprot:TRINITY_DN30946_c0_g1_i1.p1 TRINITY_DN30946_c0_g1~~TRINITY_DN30946_c0_g1_i1.p1  ORF type:complete len:814 (+),score=152.26 TRINITY_DN30946_c0_g1_i1:37-2478(+)